MTSPRYVHETWDYADLAALQAAIVAETAPWTSASTFAGCSIDTGVTYNGHATLKYDPSAASGSPAQLVARITGGYRRHWSRTVLLMDDLTLYDSGGPSDGDIVPAQVRVSNTTQTITAGLWEKQSGDDYRFIGQVTGASDQVESDIAVHTDLQTYLTTPLTWDVLTERYDSGDKVRVRAWLNGDWTFNPYPVLDALFAPTDDAMPWTLFTLILDTGTSAAENTIHVGEIELWDGERHPDPFGYGYRHADGFDDYTLTVDTEYGAQFSVFTDSGGKTGPNYIAFRPRSGGNAYDFLGKDMSAVAIIPVPESEVCIHGHVLFTNMAGVTEYELCSFRNHVAVAPGVVGNNAEHCAFYLVQTGDTTAILEFRLGDGTVVDESPTEVTLRTFAEWRTENYEHFLFHVLLDESSGFIRVLRNGLDWWSLYGIPTTSLGGQCFSTTIGHAKADVVGEPFGDTTANYQAWDDWVITRGLEYGVVAVEHLHPGKDGLQPVGVTFETVTQTTQDPDAMWEHTSNGNQLEPDVDSSAVDTAFPGDDVLCYPAPLPDYPCIGEIMGLVPTAMFSGIDSESFAPQGRTVLDDGTTYVESHTVEVREYLEDPPSLPYQGFSGYLHHRPYMWPTQLTSGDAWVNGDLDTLQFGVTGVGHRLSVSTLSLMALCVSPPEVDGTTEVTSFIFPHRNLEWREATQAFAQKNLAMREARQIWEMRNLEWRLVFEQATAEDLRLCPDGRVPVSIVDDMQSDVLNHRIWDTMEENFLNPGGGGGIIEATVDGLVFNGPDEVPDGLWVETRGWYLAHLLGTQIEVPDIIAASANQAQFMEWYFGGSGWGIQYRNTNVEFYSFTVSLGIYTVNVEAQTDWDLDGSTRWWKLEHTDTNGEDRITAYISADGGVDTPWVEVGHLDGVGLADDGTVFPPNVQIRVGIGGRWSSDSGLDIESSGMFRSFSTSNVPHV